MVGATSQLRGFISYSHHDGEEIRCRLTDHLQALEDEGLVSFWSDRQLRGGEGWEARILDALHEAHVVLMLVTPSVMTSKFIRRTELPKAEAQAAAGRTLILPVIAKPVMFEPVFGRIQVIPQGGRSSQHMGSRDRWCLAVTREVKEAIGAWQERRAAHA